MEEPNVDLREQAEMKRLLKNRVIIRVWTSSLNPVNTGRGMGHVSIQTKNSYISLWPAEPATAADRGRVFPHAFSSDYMQDFESEGQQPPQYIFCFYALNSGEIDKAYEIVKETLEGWTMAPYGINTQGAESCSTLAWKMLDIGGISKLVSGMDRSIIGSAGSSQGSGRSTRGLFSAASHGIASNREAVEQDLREIRRGFRYAQEMTFSILVESPDSVAAALVKAKQCELAKYPITGNIKKFPGETNVVQQQAACLVM